MTDHGQLLHLKAPTDVQCHEALVVALFAAGAHVQRMGRPTAQSLLNLAALAIFSGGGVVDLIAASVDDVIQAALPLLQPDGAMQATGTLISAAYAVPPDVLTAQLEGCGRAFREAAETKLTITKNDK